jgi:hypothetical protein
MMCRYDELQQQEVEDAKKAAFQGETLTISGRKQPVDVAAGAHAALRRSGEESRSWSSVVFVPGTAGKRPRRKSTGNICCVAAVQAVGGPECATAQLFAVGSTTGWVSLYKVFPGYAHSDETHLLAECQPHRQLVGTLTQPDAAAVRTIELSADGGQVLTTHRNGTLQLFQIFNSPTETLAFMKPPGTMGDVRGGLG